ncbi:MAG TPA: hypothetical protein VGQ83_14260 [Polyangia bacterium]
MTNRVRLLGFLLLMAITGGARPATAAPCTSSTCCTAGTYCWLEDVTTATQVYIGTTTLTPNVTYTFKVANYTPVGTMAVMHLTYGTLFNEVPNGYNDNCPGSGGTAACITYKVPAGYTQPFYLIVYAYGPNYGGRYGMNFNLFWNGANVGQYRTGGYSITTNQGSQESFETVLVNDGAGATGIARLDWNGSHYVPRDLQYANGVGLGTRMMGGTATSTKWLIATATPPPGTREGPVRALRNDRQLRDLDGDGLGDFLEDQLCICKQKAGVVCGFDCSTVTDPRDTDGDGLPDFWEATGCSTDTRKGLPAQQMCPNASASADNAQYLPLWGASPRHKDFFVEIDRLSSCGTTMGRTNAEFVAARFSSITGMNNPDGVAGIAAHFDLPPADLAADPCNNESGDADGISKVCGNFGGASVVSTTCSLSSPTISNIRQTIFHWAEEDCSAGTSIVGSRVSCFGSRTALTHELGHQLGLQHWGASSAGDVNRKPNYPSLMNYAYQDQRNGLESGTAFSDGTRAAVNPASLDEASGFSPGADISFMLSTPYNFTEFSPGSHWIDWNRDGYMDSAPVRAAVAEQAWHEDTWDGNTGYDHPVMQEIEDMPDSNSTLAPAGARYTISSTSWTFVVVADQTTHRFKYTQTAQRAGSWVTPYLDIGTDAHRSDSQPALVNFLTSAGPRLVLFGATTGGQIHYATMDAYGWYPWSTPLSNPAGTTFREVSAAVLGGNLYIVARDDATNNVYYGSFDWYLNFSGWTAAMVGGSPIRSADYTPGVAAGPDGRLYLGVKAATGKPRVNLLDLYIFSGGVWTYGTATWQDNDVVAGRPAMLWRAYVYANSNPLNTGNGALYFWYPGGSITAPSVHYRWTWGTFSATEQSYNMGKWHSPNLYNASVCGDTTMNANSGIGLVNRNDVWDKNIEAFVPHGSITDCDHHTIDTVHVPHADGEIAPSRGVAVADLNDYPVLSSHLCTTLSNPSVTCGGGLRAEEPHEVVICNGIR